VLADWSAIVGPAIAAVTTPRRLAPIVTIACAGPIAMEPQHLYRGDRSDQWPSREQDRGRAAFVQTPELLAMPCTRCHAARSAKLAAVEATVSGLPEGELRGALARWAARCSHPQPIEVPMTLTRRSTLTLAGGAVAAGLIGYLDAGAVRSALAPVFGAADGCHTGSTRDQRKAERRRRSRPR
jgi:hypothetical protein